MCGWQRYRTFVVAASSGGSPQSPAYSRACLLDAACLFSFSCPIWFVLCSGTYILYFGLLLDTTSRVSNFSPSPDKDVSLKQGVPLQDPVSSNLCHWLNGYLCWVEFGACHHNRTHLQEELHHLHRSTFQDVIWSFQCSTCQCRSGWSLTMKPPNYGRNSPFCITQNLRHGLISSMPRKKPEQHWHNQEVHFHHHPAKESTQRLSDTEAQVRCSEWSGGSSPAFKIHIFSSSSTHRNNGVSP